MNYIQPTRSTCLEPVTNVSAMSCVFSAIELADSLFLDILWNFTWSTSCCTSSSFHKICWLCCTIIAACGQLTVVDVSHSNPDSFCMSIMPIPPRRFGTNGISWNSWEISHLKIASYQHRYSAFADGQNSRKHSKTWSLLKPLRLTLIRVVRYK